ncbi:MAG: hypothetical protein H6908_05740 [Hyphomicrobiales bacterium]|nr:hypothetical protein [Hyphomicrobiales bacterium]
MLNPSGVHMPLLDTRTLRYRGEGVYLLPVQGTLAFYKLEECVIGERRFIKGVKHHAGPDTVLFPDDSFLVLGKVRVS